MDKGMEIFVKKSFKIFLLLKNNFNELFFFLTKYLRINFKIVGYGNKIYGQRSGFFFKKNLDFIF